MADTKIKFSAEGIQGIHLDMQSIFEDAVKISKLWEDSGDRILSNLEQQISLLEKRNQLNSSGVGKIDSNLLTPTVDISNNLTPLSTTNDLIPLLEELIKTLQEDGIKLDQSSISALDREDRISQQNSNIQGQKPGGINPQFIQSFALSSLVNTARSSDPIQAAESLSSNISTAMMLKGGSAGPIGAALAALTSIFSAEIDEIRKISPEAVRSAKQLGGPYERFIDPDPYYINLGLNRETTLQQQNNMVSTLGSTNYGPSLRESVTYQAGKDISQEDILGLARLRRNDNDLSIKSTISTLVSQITGAGVNRGLTRTIAQGEADTRISEYLRILTDLGQEQVELLGSVDTGINAGMMYTLSSVPSLQNPDTLKNVIKDIQSGLKSANTPQVEALQFQALSQINPGGSLLDYQEMREEPFSEKSQGYFETLLKNMKELSANNEDYIRNISNVFFGGQKIGISRDLANAEFGSEEWKKIYTEAMKSNEVDYNKVVENINGTVDKFDKLAAAWQATKLFSNVESITSNVDKLTKFLMNMKFDNEPKNYSPKFNWKGAWVPQIQNNVIASLISRNL